MNDPGSAVTSALVRPPVFETPAEAPPLLHRRDRPSHSESRGDDAEEPPAPRITTMPDATLPALPDLPTPWSACVLLVLALPGLIRRHRLRCPAKVWDPSIQHLRCIDFTDSFEVASFRVVAADLSLSDAWREGKLAGFPRLKPIAARRLSELYWFIVKSSRAETLAESAERWKSAARAN